MNREPLNLLAYILALVVVIVVLFKVLEHL
jgi:hypothetical protein